MSSSGATFSSSMRRATKALMNDLLIEPTSKSVSVVFGAP